MSTRGATGHVLVGRHRDTNDPIARELLEAAIRRAYSWNYTDGEIAMYADCSDKTVQRWRAKHDLPSNYEVVKWR